MNKKQRKIRCYCFMADTFSKETIKTVVGYVMEANRKKALDCVEKNILSDFGGFGDLKLAHVPKDRRDALIIAVDEKKEEEVGKITEKLFRSNTKENTEWIN